MTERPDDAPTVIKAVANKTCTQDRLVDAHSEWTRDSAATNEDGTVSGSVASDSELRDGVFGRTVIRANVQ